MNKAEVIFEKLASSFFSKEKRETRNNYVLDQLDKEFNNSRYINLRKDVDAIQAKDWNSKHLADVEKMAPTLKENIKKFGGVVLGKGMVSDEAANMYFPSEAYIINKEKNGGKTIVSREWAAKQPRIKK